MYVSHSQERTSKNIKNKTQIRHIILVSYTLKVVFYSVFKTVNGNGNGNTRNECNNNNHYYYVLNVLKSTHTIAFATGKGLSIA